MPVCSQKVLYKFIYSEISLLRVVEWVLFVWIQTKVCFQFILADWYVILFALLLQHMEFVTNFKFVEPFFHFPELLVQLNLKFETIQEIVFLICPLYSHLFIVSKHLVITFFHFFILSIRQLLSKVTQHLVGIVQMVSIFRRLGVVVSANVVVVLRCCLVFLLSDLPQNFRQLHIFHDYLFLVVFLSDLALHTCLFLEFRLTFILISTFRGNQVRLFKKAILGFNHLRLFSLKSVDTGVLSQMAFNYLRLFFHSFVRYLDLKLSFYFLEFLNLILQLLPLLLYIFAFYYHNFVLLA